MEFPALVWRVTLKERVSLTCLPFINLLAPSPVIPWRPLGHLHSGIEWYCILSVCHSRTNRLVRGPPEDLSRGDGPGGTFPKYSTGISTWQEPV
jgi:hypothetical protein